MASTYQYLIDPATGCWNWQGHLNPDGYGRVYADGVNHTVHRYFWELYNGPIPEGLQIDHKCRNTACHPHPDHLRLATNQQNKFYAAKRKAASSKYKGVYYRKTRSSWGAQIMLDGKKFNLGKFPDEESAAHAYDKKATELFGEFAYLNFPTVQGGVHESSYVDEYESARKFYAEDVNSLRTKEIA